MTYRVGLLASLLFSFFIATSATASSQMTTENNQMVAPDEVTKTDLSEEAPLLTPSIQVNISARQLRLFDKLGKLVKVYPIAVGSTAYKTPVGKRTMTKIVWNPWWLPPKSPWAKNDQPTPPGPRNPLGSVKMDLGGAILFHGTNKPKSIGHAQSHGCMRMFTEDARELAKWIQLRMTDKTGDEEFAKYTSNPRKSFHVNLKAPIPVDVVYDNIEVNGGKLYVYRDVYYRVPNKIQAIKDELKSYGHNPDDYDWDYIKSELKKSGTSLDLALDMNLSLMKNRAKREKLEKQFAEQTQSKETL